MHGKAKTFTTIAMVGGFFVLGLFLAKEVQDNEHVQLLVSSFGIFGILLVAFVSGINFIVPIPATAFTPIFAAAGFSLPVIIGTIVFGVTVADLLSYILGTLVKDRAGKQKSALYKNIQMWCDGRPRLTQLIVFVYATVFPLPNELLLFPLGALGVRLRAIIVAFVLGTTLHVTALAFGIQAIFEWIF